MRAVCRGRSLVEQVAVAGGFTGRALGLMGRLPLPPGRGLLLKPCAEIHTLFMRFPLDLIFLDEGDKVVRVARNVAPWRMVFGGRGVRAALEVTAGWMPADAVRPGDQITWEDRA